MPGRICPAGLYNDAIPRHGQPEFQQEIHSAVSANAAVKATAADSLGYIGCSVAKFIFSYGVGRREKIVTHRGVGCWKKLHLGM